MCFCLHFTATKVTEVTFVVPYQWRWVPELTQSVQNLPETFYLCISLTFLTIVIQLPHPTLLIQIVVSANTQRSITFGQIVAQSQEIKTLRIVSGSLIWLLLKQVMLFAKRAIKGSWWHFTWVLARILEYSKYSKSPLNFQNLQNLQKLHMEIYVHFFTFSKILRSTTNSATLLKGYLNTGLVLIGHLL